MKVTIAVNTEEEATIEAERDETIVSFLKRLGVVIAAPCGGNGTCGKCLVTIHLEEKASVLLACRTELEDGMIVEVPKNSDVWVESTAKDIAADRFLSDDTESSNVGIAVDLGTTTIACYVYDLLTGRLLARGGAPIHKPYLGLT